MSWSILSTMAVAPGCNSSMSPACSISLAMQTSERHRRTNPAEASIQEQLAAEWAPPGRQASSRSGADRRNLGSAVGSLKMPEGACKLVLGPRQLALGFAQGPLHAVRQLQQPVHDLQSALKQHNAQVIQGAASGRFHLPLGDVAPASWHRAPVFTVACVIGLPGPDQLLLREPAESRKYSIARRLEKLCTHRCFGAEEIIATGLSRFESHWANPKNRRTIVAGAPWPSTGYVGPCSCRSTFKKPALHTAWPPQWILSKARITSLWSGVVIHRQDIKSQRSADSLFLTVNTL